MMIFFKKFFPRRNVKNCQEIIDDLFDNKKEKRKWLNTEHVSLDKMSPQEVMESGDARKISMLMQILVIKKYGLYEAREMMRQQE